MITPDCSSVLTSNICALRAETRFVLTIAHTLSLSQNSGGVVLISIHLSSILFFDSLQNSVRD